jgi:electron transfer flavoprotein beta subunit
MTIARIAVCVKHVPGGRLRIEPESNRLDRSGPGELNKVDKNAIEEALRLKADQASDTELVVVSLGPHEAKESLRTALALGADRAVLISDPSAAGSDLVATARVLAAALEREEPDLVLFGQQTSDGGGAVLWAAVAERLHRPFASQAAELTVDGQAVRVTRQTEFGDDVIEVPLPAVVSVSDSINEPRYTSLKGMMGAKKKPLEVLTLADVGLAGGEAGDSGSKTTVLGLAHPPGRINSVKVKDEGNAARIIVDFLLEKQLA